MGVKFLGLPTQVVRALQAGGPDANGQPPEVAVSDGQGNPCRHCLREIPAGEKMLILAYRPFPMAQPYAELGPIFLCAKPCERHPDSSDVPEVFKGNGTILIRGYRSNDRILYGTGQVVKKGVVVDAVTGLFKNPDVAYVHMRSASNNCYQCRVERQ